MTIHAPGAATLSMINLALIGCGNMGNTHKQRLGSLADRMRVVATVDALAERAKSAKVFLDAALATTDYREALPHVDAVLIATPHHLHHPIGMACIAAGKHVLMEKPLANSEAECVDLITAAERAGVTLMVAYNQRYHPLVVQLGELIKGKAYGEAFHVSMWTEQFTRWPEADAWAHKAATLGGGQLFSHGCHYIDLMLDWMGEPVEGSHIGTNFGTPWMEREGTSDVAIKFANGAVAYHGATWGARGTRLGYSFHAICTEGTLELNQHEGVLYLHRDNDRHAGKHREPEVLAQLDQGGKHTDREMAHFLDCIEHKQQPLTDGWRSLQSLRVIWRLYDAEARGVVADLRGLGFRYAGPA
jgi:predicted dehydrogenase